MIRQIPYYEVEALWAEVLPYLQKVIAVQDEWTADAVFAKLTNPYDPTPFQLWHEPGRYALVTQIQAFPSGKRKCVLFLCGGEDVAAMADAQKAVERWALRYMGCHRMLISGRKGWLKVLDGYEVTNTVMEKNLCN